MSVGEKETYLNGLTVDRLPLLGMGILFGVSWWAAHWFVNSTPIVEESPFAPVWRAYDARQSAALAGYVFLALAFAWVVPLGKLVRPGEVVAQTRAELGALTPIIFLLALVGNLLNLYAKGDFLLVAPAYLAFRASSGIVSLANILAPLSLLSSGMLAKRFPVIGITLGLVMTMQLFAGGTRLLAASAGLFTLGYFLGGGRLRFLHIASSTVFAICALPIALICRNLTEHGLLPYIAAIRETLPEYGFEEILGAVTENVGFTVPLMTLTAEHFEISEQDMMTMLNPAPASEAGWLDLQPAMRIHEYIPFSMLGELARFGGLALFLGLTVWGIIVRLCIQFVASGNHVATLPCTAAMLSLSSMTFVYASQYNTRAVTRVVTVMIGVVVAERVFRFLFEHRFASGSSS